MNKTNLLLMGAGLTVAALARGATEFEEAVPVELAEIFLGLNGEEGGLYRDLPEDFALDAAPEGFTVLGSVDQQYGLTAYLSTALDADAATEALAGALAAAGWLRLPSLERVPDLGIRGRPPGGFPERLCHEEEGFMTITVPRPDEEPRVVSLRQNPRAAGAGLP